MPEHRIAAGAAQPTQLPVAKPKMPSCVAARLYRGEMRAYPRLQLFSLGRPAVRGFWRRSESHLVKKP